MTENYLKNITPDSLSGLIFGFEGIRRSLVILNGPTGCKFYHSITADNQSLRKEEMDPLHYPEEWFFGQGRVPCTYLDKRDYVYGSEGKLSDAIDFILSRITPELLVIVNTPGAALIGDDLERIAEKAVRAKGFSEQELPVITCQSPGYSRDLKDGQKEAGDLVIEKIIEPSWVEMEQKPESASDHAAEPVVNLLGLSIYQKYHAGDIKEITRLLSMCGIRVNTAFLCESSLDELKKIPCADLNIVVDTDWGLETAKKLEDRFGTPYVYSEYGYPVGFKAMEKLIQDVAGRLGRDPEPAISECQKARAQAFPHIARLNALTGLPKGAPFLVHGYPALIKGYSSFLTEYLGMAEISEKDLAGGEKKEPEVVLADGNYIAMRKAEGHVFSGIEVSLPTIGYIDVIEKTHLGASGGLLLIEQILNSFVY